MTRWECHCNIDSLARGTEKAVVKTTFLPPLWKVGVWLWQCCSSSHRFRAVASQLHPATSTKSFSPIAREIACTGTFQFRPLSSRPRAKDSLKTAPGAERVVTRLGIPAGLNPSPIPFVRRFPHRTWPSDFAIRSFLQVEAVPLERNDFRIAVCPQTVALWPWNLSTKK